MEPSLRRLLVSYCWFYRNLGTNVVNENLTTSFRFVSGAPENGSGDDSAASAAPPYHRPALCRSCEARSRETSNAARHIPGLLVCCALGACGRGGAAGRRCEASSMDDVARAWRARAAASVPHRARLPEASVSQSSAGRTTSRKRPALRRRAGRQDLLLPQR